jgi:hypothetical protein
MQHVVRFEDSKRVGKCYTGKEPAPLGDPAAVWMGVSG